MERNDCYSAFQLLRDHLLAVLDDVYVDLRSPLEETVWPPGVGRRQKLISKAQKVLRDEGFTWREVAELLREEPGESIGNSGEGAISRARARVRGYGKRRSKRS
jgi:hypothetical protein